MAGLDSYLSMGLGIAALYIGVKYGPQVVQNLQAGSKAPAQATAPAQQQPIVSPIQTDEGGAPITPTPRRHLEPQTKSKHPDNTWNPRTERIVAGTITPVSPGSLTPSGSIHEKPSTQPSRASTQPKRHITHGGGDRTTTSAANQHCVCSQSGLWEGPGCNVAGFKCPTPGAKGTAAFYESDVGYYNSYNIPTEGPGWKKSIRYNEVVASQGSMQPREESSEH